MHNVSGYRKKIVVLLAVAVLGSAAVMAVSPRSTNDEEKLHDSKSSISSLFTNDANFLSAHNNNTAGDELYSKLIISIVFVVVLGIAAIYVSKRLLPKARLSGKEMKIIETVHIGPRKAIHLLKIGNQSLLIGSTAENITKLADVTSVFFQREDTFAELPMRETDDNSGIKSDL